MQSIYDESLDKGVYEEGGDDLIPPNKTDQRDLTEILESVFSWASTGMKSWKLSCNEMHKHESAKIESPWYGGKDFELTLFLSIRIRGSPANYQQIEESIFSILHIGRQLSKYKNELPHI